MADISAPTLYYKFDDGSGTSAAEGMGTGLALTASGGAIWAPGKIGPYSTEIDQGTANYWSRASHASLNIGSSDWTIAMWVNLLDDPAAGSATIVAKNAAYSNYYWAVKYSKGSDQFYIELISFDGVAVRSNQFTATPTYVPGDGWVHIVFALENTGSAISGKWYINGVDGGTVRTTSGLDITTQSLDNTNPFYVARYNAAGGGYMDGYLDELRLYKGVLFDQTDAQDLYEWDSAEIIITSDPSNQIIMDGETGVFSITATGAVDIYYQWYESSWTGAGLTGTTGYSPMIGETGPSLYLTGVTGLQNRNRYLCAADDTLILT